MDYKKLYYRLCKYCKETEITERIIKRNKEDKRLTSDYIYSEIHHIIPKHSNGSNNEDNLVKMLPEEHFMAHLIRYRAYNNPADFYSVRFALNGFLSKEYINDIPVKTQNKMVRWFKQHTSEFRKKHDWQSPEGRKRISKARKGKMPAIDAITGEVVGSIATDHPKIQSGEWIHHSKGKVSVIEKKTGKKKYITIQERKTNKHLYLPNNGDGRGESNNNFSGFTDDELISFLVELSTKVGEGVLVSWSRVQYYYKEKENKNLPNIFKNFRFDGKGKEELYEKAQASSGFKIEKYPRGILNNNIKNRIKALIEENN